MAAKRKGSSRKSGGRKYGNAAGKSVESGVRREKKGTLRSGKGGKADGDRLLAALDRPALSEARKKGAKVPKKKAS